MTSDKATISILEKLIKGHRRELEHTKDKLNKLIEVQKIKNKRLRGERLTEEDIRLVMSITCFGSIAHCCKYTKGCPYFLSVCEVLGLDPKEVSKYKERMIDRYLEKNVEKVKAVDKGNESLL